MSSLVEWDRTSDRTKPVSTFFPETEETGVLGQGTGGGRGRGAGTGPWHRDEVKLSTGKEEEGRPIRVPKRERIKISGRVRFNKGRLRGPCRLKIPVYSETSLLPSVSRRCHGRLWSGTHSSADPVLIPPTSLQSPRGFSVVCRSVEETTEQYVLNYDCCRDRRSGGVVGESCKGSGSSSLLLRLFKILRAVM